VGLNIVSAFVMIPGKKKVLPVCFSVFFVSTAVATPGLVFEETSEYQFYGVSPYGVVIVHENTLYIDEREQCSICYSEGASERMMAVYALDPLQDFGGLSVLNIGLGCGLTLEKCLEYDTRVDVVEINYQVALANKVLTNVLTSPDVDLIVDDGLHYLRYTDKRYDAVLIDIENPTVAHSSYLYTVEAFELVYHVLSDPGTFSLWNYGVDNIRYLDILCYSLKEVFPFVYQYPGVFLASKQDLQQEEYVPTTPHEVNTIDRNTLTDAYLDN
jgi:spermidine synthase